MEGCGDKCKGNSIFLTDVPKGLLQFLFNQRHNLGVCVSDFQAECAGAWNYIDRVRGYFYRAHSCNGKFIAAFCCNLWYFADKSCRRHKRVLTVCHGCASGMICLPCHGNLIAVHTRNGGYDSYRSICSV